MYRFGRSRSTARKVATRRRWCPKADGGLGLTVTRARSASILCAFEKSSLFSKPQFYRYDANSSFHTSTRRLMMQCLYSTSVSPLTQTQISKIRTQKGSGMQCDYSSSADGGNTPSMPSNMVLFDSLSQTYKPVEPEVHNISSSDNQQTQGLAWYTCGPTVYDATHLGHARTYVCLDLIHRWMLHRHSKQAIRHTHQGSPTQPAGRPMFIMNVTDVDDKIIARAAERKEHPLKLARHYEQEFLEDLEALNVMRPTIILRVSEHVDSDIVPYIDQIIKHGMAYVLSDEDTESENDGVRVKQEGSVYFDVTAFERASKKINRYGKLAPPAAASTESFFYESNNSGADQQELKRKQRKRDPRDFVLWKQHKPQSDGNLWWDSPWGKGRPGWHIECSAMIQAVVSQLERLNYRLGVHAGGVDLKFPHHTNEIAQAEAYLNLPSNGLKEWIPHWVHTGHLYIEGLKMSKSLKNFITVRDMLSGGHNDTQNHDHTSAFSSALDCPADDFRLWCLGLSGSYRGNATYSKNRLAEARRMRETKILRFLMDGQKWIEKSHKGDRQREARKIRGNDDFNYVDYPVLEWVQADYNFWHNVQESFGRATAALDGYVDQSNGLSSGFDMDGDACLKAIIDVCELSISYMATASPGHHAIEPTAMALEEMRGLLKLLGFTEKTCLAGQASTAEALTNSNAVVGGETALAQELVDFRSEVRAFSLQAMKGGDAKDSAQNILKLCDKLRDNTLLEMGLELSDTGAGDAQKESWRFCIPRANNIDTGGTHNAATGKADIENISRNKNHLDAPLEDFFRTGPYERQFSTFDKDHLPLTNSDGTDISKSMRKKLTKKIQKHEKRLQAYSESSKLK
jgi:cysteinyl-tRNA synthetase